MLNGIQGVGTNELSTDINTITAEINAYQRVAGEAIFEIGRRLKHVKENDLAHGEFGKWLKEGVGIAHQHANRFMRIVDELDGSNYTTSFNLGVEALYQIATLPPEHRESSHTTAKGETKTPDEMTVRELRELKRQLKTEQAERERLEQENEDLSNREPEIKYETKTEYIEVDNTPHDYDEVKRRLEDYHEKFGDIRNYDESVTATHVQDMISATMSFKKAVKEFAKRFSYMTKYKDAINRMDHISKQEYNETVKALHEMADSFEYLGEGNERIIINQ